jgi:hypothetical protein
VVDPSQQAIGWRRQMSSIWLTSQVIPVQRRLMGGIQWSSLAAPETVSWIN